MFQIPHCYQNAGSDLFIMINVRSWKSPHYMSISLLVLVQKLCLVGGEGGEKGGVKSCCENPFSVNFRLTENFRSSPWVLCYY